MIRKRTKKKAYSIVTWLLIFNIFYILTDPLVLVWNYFFRLTKSRAKHDVLSLIFCNQLGIAVFRATIVLHALKAISLFKNNPFLKMLNPINQSNILSSVRSMISLTVSVGAFEYKNWYVAKTKTNELIYVMNLMNKVYSLDYNTWRFLSSQTHYRGWQKHVHGHTGAYIGKQRICSFADRGLLD